MKETIRIEFNAKELDTIYSALNNLAIYFSDKSDTMQKILAGTHTSEDMLYPDYFYIQHEFVSHLQSRVYHAEKRLEKKNA